MTVVMLEEAKAELTEAFEYYERKRKGLGDEFVTEFRRGIDMILFCPTAWNPLDQIFRSYRLNRFSYGIIYRIDESVNEIVVEAVMELHREPDYWRGRS